MADPTKRVAESDLAITRHRLDAIDDKLVEYRAAYLRAMWNGGIEDTEWEVRVDHLLDLRSLTLHERLTPQQASEVDALCD